MSEEIIHINPVTGFVDTTSNVYMNPPYMNPPQPITQWVMVATLNQATLEAIRQIMREEVEAALEKKAQADAEQ